MNHYLILDERAYLDLKRAADTPLEVCTGAEVHRAAADWPGAVVAGWDAEGQLRILGTAEQFARPPR